MLRSALPLALFGMGLVALLVFHQRWVGSLLIALGAGWFLAARLRSMMAVVETTAVQAEAPPENTQEEMERKNLKLQLMRLQAVDGCESLAERASEQFSRVEEHLRSFDRLLRSRIEPSERAFADYRSAAEQLSRSMIGRLREISELLSSIEAIRPSEIRTQILEKLQIQSAPQDDSVRALKERLIVAEKHRIKAEALLNENEKARLEMDRAGAALTAMKTRSTEG